MINRARAAARCASGGFSTDVSDSRYGSILLGLLLFIRGRHDPGLRGDPLTLGDTEFEEFGDNRGETARMLCQQIVIERV